jgi:hypothetical protein
MGRAIAGCAIAACAIGGHGVPPSPCANRFGIARNPGFSLRRGASPRLPLIY